MKRVSPCPNCEGKNVYLNKKGISGSGHAANYLPGLGGFMQFAKLYPAICKDCGLVRFFVDESTQSKLVDSSKWERQ